jgi:Sec-independent protein translocase protein TatA
MTLSFLILVKKGGNMGGFHVSSIIVVLVMVLLIACPKALQTMSRHAGKNVSQAKVLKEKVMAELPVEDISGISQSISKIPLSPQQAIQMLLTPSQEDE